MRVIRAASAQRAGQWAESALTLEYSDGVSSARGETKLVKHNTQARADHPATRQLLDEVREALEASDEFRIVAHPRHFVRLGINRYRSGDHYGMHVDVATMGPVGSSHRTDLSFTLFLSEPDSYEGGELQIAGPGAASTFKLPPGQLVVYPTGLMHQVTPVRSGERLAVIGWVESWIADPVLRETITKLQSLEAGSRTALSPLARVQLNEVVAELIRYGSR